MLQQSEQEDTLNESLLSPEEKIKEKYCLQSIKKRAVNGIAHVANFDNVILYEESVLNFFDHYGTGYSLEELKHLDWQLPVLLVFGAAGGVIYASNLPSYQHNLDKFFGLDAKNVAMSQGITKINKAGAVVKSVIAASSFLNFIKEVTGSASAAFVLAIPCAIFGVFPQLGLSADVSESQPEPLLNLTPTQAARLAQILTLSYSIPNGVIRYNAYVNCFLAYGIFSNRPKPKGDDAIAFWIGIVLCIMFIISTQKSYAERLKNLFYAHSSDTDDEVSDQKPLTKCARISAKAVNAFLWLCDTLSPLIKAGADALALANTVYLIASWCRATEKDSQSSGWCVSSFLSIANLIMQAAIYAKPKNKKQPLSVNSHAILSESSQSNSFIETEEVEDENLACGDDSPRRSRCCSLCVMF